MRSFTALILPLAYIGWVASRASAQENREGWVFDDPVLSRIANRIPRIQKNDDKGVWMEIWEKARSAGPLLTHQLLHYYGQANREELELCLLDALGLSGGSHARKKLGSLLSDRNLHPDFRVHALLAASRPRVAFGDQRFRKILDRKGGKPQVVTLAERIAVLASGVRVPAETFSCKDPQLGGTLRVLQAVWDPSGELDRSERPAWPRRPPAEGSLADFQERALLFLAIAHPGTITRGELETLLNQPRRDRIHRLASLALGRLMGRLEGDVPELENLKIPRFFAGLSGSGPVVESSLLRGPGTARVLDWRIWHWGVAVRLLSSENLERILDTLLDLDPEVGELALRALCWRLLVKGMELESRLKLRQILRAPVGSQTSPYRLILGVLANRPRTLPEEFRSRLGPFRTHALQMFLEGRLSPEKGPAGPLLWKLLMKEEWVHPLRGPASFEQALLEEMNQWVWDIFLLGSEEIERTRPKPKEGGHFLPDGIRRTRREHFRTLAPLLEIYPLFRSWPGRDS